VIDFGGTDFARDLALQAADDAPDVALQLDASPLLGELALPRGGQLALGALQIVCQDAALALGGGAAVLRLGEAELERDDQALGALGTLEEPLLGELGAARTMLGEDLRVDDPAGLGVRRRIGRRGQSRQIVLPRRGARGESTPDDRFVARKMRSPATLCVAPIAATGVICAAITDRWACDAARGPRCWRPRWTATGASGAPAVARRSP